MPVPTGDNNLFCPDFPTKKPKNATINSYEQMIMYIYKNIATNESLQCHAPAWGIVGAYWNYEVHEE
jgi:hypothetical protein